MKIDEPNAANEGDCEVPSSAELDKVIDWRREELERAGFEPSAALVIAARAEIDLHLATELVRKGCPPPTALRILV